MAVGVQRHASAILPTRKRPGTHCRHTRGLGGPYSRSEGVRKISPLLNSVPQPPSP